jgi:hypothetical protein
MPSISRKANIDGISLALTIRFSKEMTSKKWQRQLNYLQKAGIAVE